MQRNEVDPLEDYKIELLKVYEKSQDSFEKQLSYISAGGLGLSMIFIEKIVKNVGLSNCKWLLALSWILLGSTLVINLISHSVSAKSTYKTLTDIEENNFDIEKVKRRIRSINILNNCSIFTLLMGILLLIVFVTINLYTMKYNTNEIEHPKPQTGQNPPPPPIVKPTQPNTPPKK
ncbi:MAG: hypothetical protein JST50_11310 [Bacteroidetes bacterium]|jgi:hypothetical protein|nr:hypothetical protein [Bacteroidota bacterium]